MGQRICYYKNHSDKGLKDQIAWIGQHNNSADLQSVPTRKTIQRNWETAQKNGEKIKPGSIQNYYYVMNNLIQFSSDAKF